MLRRPSFFVFYVWVKIGTTLASIQKSINLTRGKNLLIFAAAGVLLFLAGAVPASADCTEFRPVTVATTVHAEGTTELMASMTIVCRNPGSAVHPAFVGSVPSNLSLVFFPPATQVTIGAGTTPASVPAAPGVQNICSALPADNRSTFPCPQIQAVSSAGASIPTFATPVTVTTSGNILNFNFTACAPTGNPDGTCAGSAAGTVTFTITGIRISVASTALPAGGAVVASEVNSGGIGTVSWNSAVFGIVQQTLAPSSGFSNPIRHFTPTAPPVATPLGQPATLAGNPDTSAGASNSLKVTLFEGFLQAFVTAGTLDGGSPSQTAPGISPGAGLRFRVILTGVPSGWVTYAPEIVNSSSAANTGSVGGGSVATVLTRVIDSRLDASGGGVIATPIADQYDLLTPNGGVVSLVYEVTTATSVFALETVSVNVTLTGTAPTGSGTIDGQVTLGPIGPPTVNPNLPQFAVLNTPSVVATVFDPSVLPVINSFSPSSGPVGTQVLFLGSGLTGTTTVTFNGIPATTFAVVDDNTLTATVPSGGSGIVAVVKPSGTAFSATPFTITPPSVTINQSATQPDPTDVSPINFTVLFSEAVTGFGNSGVTLSGTAGATTVVVTGSGASYNVAASGMTASGSVIATIGAGVATSAISGLGNAASSITDNTVTFLSTPLPKKRAQVTSE